MLIKKIKVSKINPAPYNPRVDLKPGDPEYEKLKNSISSFGYVEPLVWNKRTKTLISGHQRLKILIEQGLKEVEVSVVDLPIEKEKVLNIALNKISGDWDENLLAGLLEDLIQIPDFDVGLTGFDPPEISNILDSQTEIRDDDFDFDACLDSIEKSVTKKGDLIELGRHKIICGDSSNLEDLKKLLGTEKVNLLHTDPPYNVNYYGGNRPIKMARPAKHRLWKRIYSDDLTQEQYVEWLKKIFENLAPFLAPGAPVYIWNGHKQFGPMNQMLEKLDFHVSCVITWAKPNFAISYGDFNNQTEFCLYGWKNDNGAHNWYGPTNESTLWQIKRDTTKEYIHPTQKPVALPYRAIRNSSKRGDLILDLFLGSGSTLIAAENLERRCFGIEIDARYCDAIVHRYIAYKGIKNVPDTIKEKYLEKENNHERK